jgi:glucuronoarabinoxylan endo-1,4-beta-xylanase
MKHIRHRKSVGIWIRGAVGVVLFYGITSLSQIHAQGINDAVIYLDNMQQVIRGFGAANILRWRPDMTADEIDKAFGTDEGQIGLTILRLRIPPDPNSFIYNTTTAQAAYARGVKIIASPWSPPAWMKTNNNIVGGRLRASYYANYAEHLKSFVDYMADNGVPLYAVSVQNEPDVRVDYESCDWNAEEMLAFVKENAPSIGVDIIVPESFNFNHTISDAILNDSTAASHAAIIGGHIYGGGLRSYPLAESKGKEIWMTEHLDTDTTWNHVLATGKEMNDCMTVGMSAYIWWYIVRFYGPISEDGNVSKRGYVMSQYSKFIRPGYVRVDATERPQTQVYLTAYKSDSKLIIVVVNTGSSSKEQTFKIENLIADSIIVTPYVTSKTKNCFQESDITLANGSFTALLDGSSVTTFAADDISKKADSSDTLPQTITLFQNYPNPFNPTTDISYSISKPDFVILKIYNLLGREIQTLIHQYHPAGKYTVTFNAENLSSGIYFYTLQVSGNIIETKKMILIR